MLMRLLRSPDLPPLAALLAVSLLVVAPALLTGRALLPSDALFNFLPWRSLAAQFGVTVPYNDLAADMILQNYSWKELVKQSYLSGEFPLWNPSILTGLPLLAAGQAGPLYPLGLPVFLLLPTAHAYAWFMALHLFIAGAGTYALARTLGADRVGGLVGGLTFGLCGFLVVSFMWPQMVSAAAWMPLMLLCQERMVRHAEGVAGRLSRSSGLVLWAAAGAVVVALQFLAGHMEMSFYGLFMLLCAFLARLPLTLRSPLGWRAAAYAVLGAGLMVGTGILLAGIQIVPFIELIRQNERAGGITLADAVSFALPKLQAVAFLLPDFFGNPTHHSYFDLFRNAVLPVEGSKDLAGAARSYPFWGVKNYVEGTAYVGLLPLLLAAAGLALRRDRYALFFGGYGLFSLLLAFGTPLYGLFFFGIPGMDQLHTPFRWVLPYSLCVAVLAALGVTALRVRQVRLADWLARWLGILVAACAGGVLTILAGGYLLKDDLLGWVEGVRQRSDSLGAAFPSPEMLLSYQYQGVLVFALLLLLTGGALALALRSRNRALLALLPLVLTLDLVHFAWGFLAFTDPAIPASQTELVTWLRAQGDGQPFRVVSYPSSDILPPDTAMLAGVHDVRGYDTVIPRQYAAFWRLMEEPSGLAYSQINRIATPQGLESRYLDLLNVRYVLSRDQVNSPGLSKAFEADGVQVYLNADALPRAFTVTNARQTGGIDDALSTMREPRFNPRTEVLVQGPALAGVASPLKPASVAEYQPNRVTIKAVVDSPAYLVLTDAFFDGWQAQNAAGRSLDVVRANAVFRGVLLEPGDHTITFSYRPVTFRLGGYLSFVGFVLTLLMGGYVAWQRLAGPARTDGSAAARVARNSVTPLTAQIIARFVDFGFAIFMLRWLGPVEYGGYAFAVVLIGYFAIVTDYGLGTLITRDVSADRTLADSYFRRTVAARLLLCAAVTPPLLAVALAYNAWFGLQTEAVIAVMLFMASLVPGAIAGAVSSLLSAYQRMEYQAGMTIVTTVLRALLGLIVLVAGFGVIGLGAVSVVASLFNAGLFWLLVRRAGLAPAFRLELGGLRSLLTEATPLMLNSLLSSIFFRVDILVLQAMRGAEAVAFYSTGYKFIDGMLLISSFFTLAFFPVMAQYARENPQLLMRTYQQALKGLLLLGLPIATVTTFVAEPLIVTFFGPEFQPAVRPLQVLIWFLPLSYVNGLTQYVLIALNQQRYLTRAFVAAVGFNLAGNIAIVPVMGMEGAALMTILSEVVLLAPFLRGIYRHLGPLPLLGLAWRPVVASAALAATLWGLATLPLPISLAVGGVVYGATILGLGALDAEDWATLRRVIGRDRHAS